MSKKGGRNTSQLIGNGMGPWRWTFFSSGRKIKYKCLFQLTPVQLVGILVRAVGMATDTLECL